MTTNTMTRDEAVEVLAALVEVVCAGLPRLKSKPKLKAAIAALAQQPAAVDEAMVERMVEAFLASTGQQHSVTQLQRDLTTKCMKAALAAMGGQGEGRYPCPRGCDCRGRDCPDCANFTAPQQPEARVGGEVKRYGDLRGTYAATPPPSAVPEIVGWLHEVVWEDGTAYSFYRNQPGLLGPRPGLVSERIGRAAFIAAAPQPGEGE